MEKKIEIRKKFLRQRDQFVCSQSLPQAQQKITQNIIGFLNRQPTAIWSSYRAKGSEVKTLDALKASAHIRWVFPVVQGDQVHFFEPSSLEKGWAHGAFNILQPNPETSSRILLEEINGFLIPGIAFDRKGQRIGWGKGYYDKVLDKFNGQKVGLAFSVQVSQDELPSEDHDKDLDVLITEDEVIYINERKVS